MEGHQTEEAVHKLEKKTQDSISIFHQNVDRISNKIERIDHLLHSICPDILILTEHGHSLEKITHTRLNNYSLISAFCRTNVFKGGVAIYKHDGLSNEVSTLNVEQKSVSQICEVSAISIKINKKRMLHVLGIYRPPKNDEASLASALDILSNILDSWQSQNNTIIIIGDYNVDILKPTTAGRMLVELLATYNIQRLALPPTRRFKNSISSIDMVCISSDSFDCTEVNVIKTGISDHTGQLCTLDCKAVRREATTTTRRNLSRENLESLRKYLAGQKWYDVYEAENVEDAYDLFSSTISFALDMTCPLEKNCTKLKSSLKPAYDTEAMTLKEQFLEAQNKYIISGKEDDRKHAAFKKKTYDMKLRSLKQEACADFIANANNKNKAIWKVINSERQAKGTSGSGVSSLLISNKSVDDPVELANHFNHFFTSVAGETLKSIQSRKPLKITEFDRPYPLQEFDPTTQNELIKIISSMKNKMSSGLDEFSIAMVKYCLQELLPPMLDLVNKSLGQGFFPSRLKHAKVIPLHKKGSKVEVGNYRPISLVSTFSKIIEKVVLRRILDHLQKNNIILEEQHGFLQNKSTQSALVSFVEHVIDRLEEGENVIGLFLDLSKAFDCLSHDTVIEKLRSLGFQKTALSWFDSFLRNRDQIVELTTCTNNKTAFVRSQRLPVSRGVPQGSVLGPVIFILYTFDLPDYTAQYCKTIMYADDTVLLTSNRCTQQLEIQSYIALNMAVEYCDAHDLVFNESKTNQVTLGRRKEDISPLPNLQLVEATKHLGIFIDNNLSWIDHLDSLCSKLSSALYALRRVMTISTGEAARMTYHSLFESNLRYGIVLWGAASHCNLQRVLLIQKRAVRMLAGLDWGESCRSPFKTLRILTVVNIYIMEVITTACRSTQLPRNEMVHSHNTRRAHDFNLLVHNTSRFEKKPTYAGARLFNRLPDNIKSSRPQNLKSNLKDWLLDRPFYSVAEFLSWRDP